MFSKLRDMYKKFPVEVKASIWFFICSFLQRGISTISTPIFTRLLTTAEYGQYSVFNSWLNIVTVFVSLHLYSGVYQQGLIKYEKDKDLFSSSLEGLTCFLVLGWTCVYLVFHDFFNQLFSLTTVQMLAMLVMIWSSAMFSFWSVRQRVELKYKSLVILTLGMSVAKPAVGIIFVLLADDKVTARILGLALVELVLCTPLFLNQFKKDKRVFDKHYWKYALMYNLPLVPHYLSTVILNSTDRIMIQSLVGSNEAGIYNLAYTISQIMTLLNTALLNTITPWLYKKIKDKKIEDISTVAYSTFILVAVVNIIVIALAPEIVSIFAPSAYYDAIWIIPPVAMSVFFMFSYSFFASFEFYYEKTTQITIATVSGAILNIALNYIFIRIFGYYAAGYTTLICYMVYACVHFYFMRKICNNKFNGKQPYQLRYYLAIVVIFLTTGFLLLLTYNYAIIRYSIILLGLFTLIIMRKPLINFIMKLINIRRDK